MEGQQVSARNCDSSGLEQSEWYTDEPQTSASLVASLGCGPEARKAPSESDQSTRSPTTEESAEIDEYLAREIIHAQEIAPQHEPALVTSFLDAATNLQLWADEPDESGWSIPATSTWSPPPPPKSVPQNSRSSSSPKSLVLRGLPFNIAEADILSFIKLAGLSRDDLTRDSGILLLTNAQGRPSGFAEIHLNRAVDLREVHERLHMKRIGGRYIEVLAPRQVRKRGGGGNSRNGPKNWRRT